MNQLFYWYLFVLLLHVFFIFLPFTQQLCLQVLHFDLRVIFIR